MTEWIAPCPACGGSGTTGKTPNGHYAYIQCHNRECSIVAPLGDTEAGAIAAWNRLAAAVKLAEVAGEWLREGEETFGPQPDDWAVFGTTVKTNVTFGMIRDAAPPAEKEDGND